MERKGGRGGGGGSGGVFGVEVGVGIEKRHCVKL